MAGQRFALRVDRGEAAVSRAAPSTTSSSRKASGEKAAVEMIANVAETLRPRWSSTIAIPATAAPVPNGYMPETIRMIGAVAAKARLGRRAGSPQTRPAALANAHAVNAAEP